MTRVRTAITAATCCLLLVGCGSDAEPDQAASAPTSTPTPTPKPERPPRPEPGEVEVDGVAVQGEWEGGDLLGEPLELPGGQILYAAPRSEVDGVNVGIRDGDRILRTIPALVPETVEEPDGINLYGGDVLGDRGPDELVADGTYLLLGSVPGDVDVSVAGPDERARPVTGSSTEVLAGFTVFYVADDWADGWDQLQRAPLTVRTSDGSTVAVRERSWTG